ncbi:acyltransferase family protein [Carnobacteriaceae bacterium zg-C25]|nr:acyltransferase family protein [Carnobacteriaceae bacterium zg-C25]
MQKKNYLSVLNVLSSFAVIALHVNDNFWHFSNTRSWHFANLIESVFYFAVPIFFMISGATLLNYQEKYSTKVFLKKRVMRTMIPFVAWSSLAWFFIRLNMPQRFEGQTIKQWINGFLLSEYNQFFWYFPVLFSVYLSIPLFASIDASKRKQTFEYLLLSTFIFNVLSEFIYKLTNIAVSNFPVVAMSGYLFFVVAGFYIAHYPIEKIKRLMIYALGAVGLLIHFYGTYKLSVDANTLIMNVKGYINLPSVLYAVAIFTAIRYAKIPSAIVKVTQLFEKQTFGIYLIHWFVLRLLYINHITMASLFEKVIWTITVFLVSWLIVFIIQKIPVLKKIV